MRRQTLVLLGGLALAYGAISLFAAPADARFGDEAKCRAICDNASHGGIQQEEWRLSEDAARSDADHHKVDSGHRESRVCCGDDCPT